MWTFLVVLSQEVIEASLLRAQVGCGRTSRLGLQSTVHALMSRVVLRASGPGALDRDAQLQPMHDRRDSPPILVGQAKGLPLSLCTASGKPCSL